MNIIFRTSVVSACLITLIASGGGEPATEAAPDGNNSSGGGAPVYQTLSATQAADLTLAGVALNRSVGMLDIGVRLNSQSGSATINGASGEHVVSSGFLSDAPITSSGTSVQTNGALGFAGAYEYVTPIKLSTANEYEQVIGVVGIQTQASDITRKDSVSYVGEASANVVTSQSAFDYIGGKSTLTINYGTQSAQISLNQFTVLDQLTGQTVADVPFDQIEVTNAFLYENIIMGGSVTLVLNGRTLSGDYSVTSSSVQGNLYGIDNGGADEVGGIVSLSSSAVQADAVFIAD